MSTRPGTDDWLSAHNPPKPAGEPVELPPDFDKTFTKAWLASAPPKPSRSMRGIEPFPQPSDFTQPKPSPDVAALVRRLKATAGPAADVRDFIALEAELTRLAASREGWVAWACKMEAERDNRADELSEAKAEITRLTAERDELEGARIVNRNALRTAKAEIARLTAERDTLTTSYRALEQAAEIDTKDHRARLDAAKAEIARLTKQIETFKTVDDALEASHQQFRLDNDREWRAKLDHAKAEIARLRKIIQNWYDFGYERVEAERTLAALKSDTGETTKGAAVEWEEGDDELAEFRAWKDAEPVAYIDPKALVWARQQRNAHSVVLYSDPLEGQIPLYLAALKPDTGEGA